jgi:FdhE protein
MVSGPRVVLPTPDLFSRRAARLDQRAVDHGMAGYLKLMAAVAHAQHDIFGHRLALLPDSTALGHSREHGMPPLATLHHLRDARWGADLDDLMGALAGEPKASAMLQAVAALDFVGREALADRILSGQTQDSDAAAAPLVGAALQVCFMRQAAALDVALVQDFELATACPVCGARPMASVVRQGGGRDKLRYLVCSLCATEWNLARIQCSTCLAEGAVSYLAPSGQTEVQGQKGTVQACRAEACDACKSYLKIFSQEHDPQIEPLADDLATLALDVAVDASGYARSGPNLLLHPGAG